MISKCSMYLFSVCFNNADIAAKILNTKKPQEMKNLGRKVKNYDDDVWSQKRFEVVKTGNRHKVSINFLKHI